MKNIKEYLSQFKPNLDRENSKYYSEMQVLAYNLVKYLKMNDALGEDDCQGNYNLTYLEENMTKEDYMFIAERFLGRIAIYEVRNMLYAKWGKQTADLVFKDFTPKQLIDELKRKDNVLFTRINAGDKDIYTFAVDKKEE